MLQPFSSKSVIKAGNLELGGIIRWKSYFFTLTKFGFLHYFASIQVNSQVVLLFTFQKLEPEGSIPLCHCEVIVSEKNSFFLEYSPPSFFATGTKYLLRASKESEMVEWIIELKKFTKIPIP
jgi:hypothetical protein